MKQFYYLWISRICKYEIYDRLNNEIVAYCFEHHHAVQIVNGLNGDIE